jgi:hypothetical protein
MTPVLKGLTVVAATAAGGPVIGALATAGVNQSGGKLNLKQFAKDAGGAAIANGAAGKAISSGMTKVTQSTNVGAKALGAVVTVQNKVGNVGLSVSNSLKQVTTSKGVTSVKTSVGTAFTKGAVAVSKIDPMTIKAVVKPSALINSDVQKMTQKAMEAGKINVNEIKQTLLNKGLPASNDAVNVVKNSIQQNFQMVGGTKSSLPVVSQLTKSTLQTLVPSISNVTQRVQESGKVDLTKVWETLKQNGIEATSEALQQVGEAIQTQTGGKTPVVNPPSVSWKMPAIIFGVLVALVGLVLYFKKK